MGYCEWSDICVIDVGGLMYYGNRPVDRENIQRERESTVWATSAAEQPTTPQCPIGCFPSTRDYITIDPRQTYTMPQ